jgi:pSer/pThr/pTyr-binding forkhead associated (FHA) protein
MILSGENEGRGFNLSPGMIRIGASSLNEIALKEKGVAGFHAQIKTEGNKYIISNLGSPSGIIINGKKINEAEIKAGDIIELGEARLKIGEAEGKNGEFASPSAPVKTQKKESELFYFWKTAQNRWRIALIILFLMFICLLVWVINWGIKLAS